jgi:hypothetical protein
MTDAQDIVGLDAVDLDMIQRGDMLGPGLGAKTFAVLVALSAERERQWCLSCGTVTRDGKCDCTNTDRPDLQNLVNYADELQREAVKSADRIKELEGALGDAPCPRPANVRPDDETVRTCIDSGFGGGCQFCGALNTSPPIGKENEGNRT